MSHNVDFPVGPTPEALLPAHFPTPEQAFIWRNWGLVPTERLAKILSADLESVHHAATALGLPVPAPLEPRWQERGYLTIIRNNWHLLTLEQICLLLGWSKERLNTTLRDEDFLWIKLGSLKPTPTPLALRPLTAEQELATERLRLQMEPYSSLRSRVPERRFSFLDASAAPASPKAADVINKPLRLIYAYSAPYGDALLEPRLNPYPDQLLEQLASLGVNGVWWPVTLYDLVPLTAEAPNADECRKRRRELALLAKRIADKGHGLYLYLNEPRALPPSAQIWQLHPERKGLYHEDKDAINPCTSSPGWLDYLEHACATLFREAPALAGVLTITMSEYPTHCHSHRRGQECPKCRMRTAPEVISEIIGAMVKGIHSEKPNARVIAWDWAWAPEWAHLLIDRLPLETTLMSTSEWGLPLFAQDGQPHHVIDYSISKPGPSQRSIDLWEHARRRGLRTMAKIQVNASWELSAVPWIPVPYLVQEHLRNLKEAEVNDLMLSWTVGAYPGGNLELLDNDPETIARRHYAPNEETVIAAWQCFSNAFRHFPFSSQVIYTAPHNAGPSNLLYAEATGYRSTMVQGFPYDDLDRWRSFYEEEEFEQLFEQLCFEWKRGIELLETKGADGTLSGGSPLHELHRISLAAWCHFRSTLLQIRFIRMRDDATKHTECCAILHEELELAVTLANLINVDSRLGFEAANHYAYTSAQLQEKILNVSWLLENVFNQQSSSC